LPPALAHPDWRNEATSVRKGPFALAMVSVLLSACVGWAEPPPTRVELLRVITFNLFHGGAASGLVGDAGALEERLAMTVAELRRTGADVIALQEASIGRGRGNVAGRIARELGYYVAHAPASERMFGGWFLGWTVGRLATLAINFNEGSAVLSRWPIVDRQIYDLPRCGRRLIDPRVLLRVEIASPMGRLNIFSTHTSGEACQLERIEAVVHGWRGASPSLLMGDLNETEDFPALARLTTRAGFTDAFRAANPEDAGYTDLQEPGAPAPTVSRRYDYVFLVPSTRGRGAILGSRVVLNEPRRRPDGTTVWPSDHYGVLAELDLSRR
jgi:endonuclease/exonuclease/phosphatase family metal-dependent hydrolase